MIHAQRFGARAKIETGGIRLRMVKVAIIGTGRFAKHHISVWRLIREIELVGVHGAHNQRLNSFDFELHH